MAKFLSRSVYLLLIIITITLIYISYFGIKTDRFDNLIKDRANKANKFVKIEFQETKIYLNLRELNLVIKLQDPKILIKGNEIVLSNLDLFLPVKSFFTDDFLLKRTELSFSKNDIRDITKVTRIFLPKIINKQLNKIFLKGTIEGKFLIPFKPNGDIGKNYGFSGKISDASINATKKVPIKKLTMNISHIRDLNDDIFELTINNGFVHDLNIRNSKINIKREKENFKVESLLATTGKLNHSEILKLSSLFNLNISNLKNINSILDLETKVNFDLNKRFVVKNLSYSSNGIINYLEVEREKKKLIAMYLPDYQSKIVVKDTKIDFNKSKLKHRLELNGLIKIQDDFDNIIIKETYDYKKKSYDINGSIDLTNSKVVLSQLNYTKNTKEKAAINFDVNFSLNKFYNIKKLSLESQKNIVHLLDVDLNKNFEVDNFDNIKVQTYKNKIKNNDFIVKKDKKIIIYGDVFDAKSLLKSLYKDNDKKTFSKKFNSEIKINFDKVLSGTNDDVINFSMIAKIVDGSYNKLSMKGNFSDNEIIEMSIYQIDKDKKTLQIISDRARPFIKNFDFIEGFEGGKLTYEAIISKNISNSNLIITDFKVSKVPALAQLLTLASLQGIADTLSGEGIRFESFEMKSNSKDKIMNIEDALAMGPAVSILLEGYVDKGKTVSLRGTLVPATKLNSIIASIPLVGDILVGKKTGEGVVGVSFKMKGPPKNIKTSVNPIKTLTPRFIVRAVEKMKKRKKEETK